MIKIKKFKTLLQLDEEISKVFLSNLLTNNSVLISGGKTFRTMLKKINYNKIKKKKISLSLTDERIVSLNSNKSNQQYLIESFPNKLINKISHQFFLKNNDIVTKKY